jgi:hypothetical protein
LFLTVSSVSTSFSWTQGAGAEGFAFESRSTIGDNVGVSGNLEYTERPTITYTPLGGADFVTSVLTPAGLETLVLLSNSGWSLERLLRLMVDRMSGLRNALSASGPTPSNAPVYVDFKRAAKLMDALHETDMLEFRYAQVGGQAAPVMIMSREAADWEETRELKRMLGLDPEKDTYLLDNEGNRARPDAVGIELRSLVGAFFFISHGIDIPSRDEAMGRVMVTKNENGEPFDWTLVVGDLFNARSQVEPPDNAQVAVEYRGSWFYIDDSDMTSKYTLLLMEQLRSLLGGKVEKEGPTLTLPVSGP